MSPSAWTLLEGIAFPSLPDSTVEEADVLRLLVAGHGGLQAAYERIGADDGARGKDCLIHLLRTDWACRSGPGLQEARELLGDASEEGGPAPVDPAAVAGRLANRSLEEWARGLEELVLRSTVCTGLVPLGGVSPDLRRLFRACVEVEDLHLAHAAWLREMAERGAFGSPPGGGASAEGT